MTRLTKLTETFNKFLETQIEYVDEVAAIKEGTYEGDIVGEIVLNNLDEFTEDELVRVLENYKYYMNQGGHILFPSSYEKARGAYPAKLASALIKSKENESITDIYNIFYREHGDLETWGEAAEMWQRDVLQNFDKTIEVFSWVMDDAEYDYYIGSVISEIEKGYPLFAKAVKTKLDKAFK
jgi:hypothetical protein